MMLCARTELVQIQVD